MRVVFTKRHSPMFPELRPAYKITQLLLVLKISSRSNKSSLERLHLFNWAFINQGNRLALMRWANGNRQDFLFWNLDPNVNQALAFAKGEGLVEFEKKRFFLTSKGHRFIEKVIESGLLGSEVEFLRGIKTRVSESIIQKSRTL